MKNKYFVISLPRTGTKTLCKMADILGLKYKHIPSINIDTIYHEYDFFADTPCYSYSFITKLCMDENNKFIYIDREPQDWYTSFNNSGMIRNFKYLLNRKELPEANVLDKNCLVEIFGNSTDKDNMIHRFKKHRNFCLLIPEERILRFSLSEGWKPLCDFVGMHNFDTSQAVPHINAGTLYEKINKSF